MNRYEITGSKLVRFRPFYNEDGEQCFSRLKHRVKKVFIFGYNETHTLIWSAKTGFAWQQPSVWKHPHIRDVNGRKIKFFSQGCHSYREDTLSPKEETPGEKADFTTATAFRAYLKPRIGDDTQIDEIMELLLTEKGDKHAT